MEIRNRILVFGSVAMVAILFVTFFSYTTSPLFYSAGDTPDSPIFQIIGKYWAEGAVPYRDLWDLKGPFIFLVNAMGYWLAGTSLGVWMLQVICMSVTVCALFKIFRCSLPVKHSACMVLLSLAGLSYMYEGGNLTEEYVLPFLSFSFYYIVCWAKEHRASGEVYHRPAVALLYGATFGLCLMSRLTNALALSGAVMVIAVVLIGNKRFRNLLLNAAAFLIGFGLTTIPFLLYFHHHGALGEMWNATFAYALIYAGNPIHPTLSLLHPTSLHYFLLSYIGSILLLCVTWYKALATRHFGTTFWLWTLSAGLPLVWFCQGNGFGHYGMTVFPLLAIALASLTSHHPIPNTSYLIALLLVVGCASKVRHATLMLHYENKNVAVYKHLLHPTSSLLHPISFIAYNCDPRLYLEEDFRPAVPFFALQDFAVSRNPLLREHVINAFMEKKPQWILLSYDPDETTVIRNVLEQYYTPVATDEEHHLRLLRLK